MRVVLGVALAGLVACVGCGREPEAVSDEPPLTAEEVASLLADEIGRWEATGKSIPVDGAPEPFEETWEVYWKVKGKSIAARMDPLLNGERVPFVGHKEYDPQEGVFIWRSKSARFPETVSREQYDPATKTYHGTILFPKGRGFPNGAKKTTTMEWVSKNKKLFTSQVEEDGKVIFSQELVLTRLTEAEVAHIERNLEPFEIAVIAAIKEFGGEVEVGKNNDVVSVNLGGASYPANSDDGVHVYLQGLRNLQTLGLSRTKVTDKGLVHLQGLTKLEKLGLSGTRVTDAGLVHLKGLMNLKELDLSDTNVTAAGLVHIEGLTNLKKLLLSGPAIADAGLAHLEGLTKLEKLGLGRTQVTDAGLEYLQGLTKLEKLGLSGTQVTDAGLVHLKGLTNLTSLNLYNTKVTDSGLVHLEGLTKLEELSLWGTKVTGAGLVHLKELTRLEYLSLLSTNVTDAAVKKLQQALPNCKIRR